ncbi:MAG TPA: CPBP family intramembrane glutamic endopeptidase [Actinomycetota bacterium]|nr:CPBP family intramembrane glutamic endopeptidase [Actinomycetota bacterium]
MASAEMLVALLLSLVAVAYNNSINWWPPFQGAAYVPANLIFSSGMAVGVAAVYDLPAYELGLTGDLDHLGMAAAALGLFALAVIAVAFSPLAHLIADARVEGRRGQALVYYTLIRIPLGTAVAEELIFRGALIAAWHAAGASQQAAAILASAAFGLWHIAPTVMGIRMNDPDAGTAKLRIGVLGGVLFTTAAGLALSWLRTSSGGLIVPIIVHAGLNSCGAVAAVAARRRISVD